MKSLVIPAFGCVGKVALAVAIAKPFAVFMVHKMFECMGIDLRQPVQPSFVTGHFARNLQCHDNICQAAYRWLSG